MIKVRRLNYAILQSSDIQRQLEYYARVMGLGAYVREAQEPILTTPQGEPTILLEQADGMRLSGLGFMLSPEEDLLEVSRKLKSLGLAAGLRSDPLPGVARSLRTVDPDGTSLDLFVEPSFIDTEPRHVGIGPLGLGHVARFTTDVERQVKFYTEVLSFKISDWRANNSAFFLRCNSDHHAINFFAGERSRLHHIAFEMRDFADIGRACDWLANCDLRLDWGPSRHIIGHNIACYHSNSDGVRVELYAEMDQMKDEGLGYFEPRPWHEDRPQRPRGWGLEFGRDAWGLEQ